MKLMEHAWRMGGYHPQRHPDRHHRRRGTTAAPITTGANLDHHLVPQVIL
ncbi:hypothetical protein AB0C27_44405 [Nonomuraea sp. NPDC048882]